MGCLKMANEKRLIDANKISYHKSGFPKGDDYDSRLDWAFREDIDKLPTVDAVEVVRCKDCKSWEQYNACDGTKPHRCMNHDAIFYKRTAPDDFCSYGERRTDG